MHAFKACQLYYGDQDECGKEREREYHRKYGFELLTAHSTFINCTQIRARILAVRFADVLFDGHV